MLAPIPLHTTNEWILGKHRAKWVIHAAKALVSATDAHLRWLLVKAGCPEFIRLGKEHFRQHEPAIAFTEDELRWMFQVIEASIPARFREAEMAKEIEKYQRKVLTDADLKGDTLDGDGSVDAHDGPTTHDGGVTIETLPDREKRLIH